MSNKLVIIDNYDSFTFNLYQQMLQIGSKFNLRAVVFRNDEVTLKQLINLNISALAISPGPGTPQDTGIARDALIHFKEQIPILGVCLGCQLIGDLFGAKVTRALKPIHGKVSKIRHDASGIFKNVESPTTVARYHSLVVSQSNFPNECLKVTATSEENEIMALQHNELPIYGLQFHPESFLTQSGDKMIRSFFEMSFDAN